MIIAALLAFALQSVPTNVPGAEACRIIRTIAAHEQQQHPDRTIIRDTHFRGQNNPIDIGDFLLGRHTNFRLSRSLDWHEAFQAAPLGQVMEAWNALGRGGDYTDCEVYEGEDWSDALVLNNHLERETQRRQMLVELGAAEGDLPEADEPIIISISQPAFDFERETALFMRNCHMEFYRRDEDGAWRPLAVSHLDLCASRASEP
jgi:hypothetical protein